jgi:hypothetical protein
MQESIEQQAQEMPTTENAVQTAASIIKIEQLREQKCNNKNTIASSILPKYQPKQQKHPFREFVEALRLGDSQKALGLAKKITESDYPLTLRNAAIEYISKHSCSKNQKLERVGIKLQQEIVDTIEKSGFLDWQWYSKNHSILAHSARDCAIHYLQTGAELGYDPSSKFEYAFRGRDAPAQDCTPDGPSLSDQVAVLCLA